MPCFWGIALIVIGKNDKCSRVRARHRLLDYIFVTPLSIKS